MEPITTLSRMVSAETSRLNLTAALREQYPRAGDGEAFEIRRLTSARGFGCVKTFFWNVQNDFIEAFCGSGATSEAARDDSV